ncbi:MAG: hypothetical protein R6U63_09330 [Longimicrobiales bacterium]
MTEQVELTARVQESTLEDGTVVYVGCIDEMPGMLTQADSRDTALADLVALVRDVRERLDLPVVGLRTEHVAGWSWEMYVQPLDVTRSFGAKALETVPKG